VSYESKEQKEANQALRNWRRNCTFGVIRWRAVTIPLAIVNTYYDLPYTKYEFRYKDVLIFGVRVARFQY
jgi:hypothetical protein